MMTKSTLWVVVCLLASVSIFSGCQSSKIAYGNSYYFKQTPKPVSKATTPIEKVEIAKLPDQSELYVSTQEKAGTQSMMEKVRRQMLETAEKSDNYYLKEKAQKVDEITSSIQEGNLSKKETRAKRKELRKELRQLVREYHAAPNEMNDMDNGLLLSIILLAGGFLFLIIGAVLGGSGGGILVLLGLLALVGGLVALIIWAANN